ncbi:probable uroporphyrinogen-III synthase [Phialocephala subalpina]|uniref:Probable uroporphyrinogen-III synthase n=1 Tax=Phialocephala subalpina TaxID=576137 RepID=A0A1L7WXX4_9HELO|nr:probable uroporphyrinogen-III synthase [Phialocephala subalpina]
MTSIQSPASDSIPILLLKTKSVPNDGYYHQFSKLKDADGERDGLKFEPTFVPVLEHQLIENGMKIFKGYLETKEIGREEEKRYGGMIFTSQRAVEAFAKLVDEGKGAQGWPFLQDIPIYTVGPATSRALRSIATTPPLQIFGSETGNGEALAHYMLDHYGQWYRDIVPKPPLLFLVGEQRRDIIPKTLTDPKLGMKKLIQVDELVVYGTGEMASFESDFTQILHQTENVKIRWVVVFSPTGCEAMLRSLGLLDSGTGKAKKREQQTGNKTYIATIGPTTRDFLRSNFDFEPDVCAAKPSPEGVEEGIRNFLKDKDTL